MHQRLLTLFILWVSLFLASGTLLLSHVSAEEQTLLIVTEEQAPYNYTNRHGEVVGENTKRVKEILTKAGLPFRIVSYPWVRSFTIARDKPRVLIYSIYKNKNRAPLFHWYCPLNKPTSIYLMRLKKNSHLTVNKLSDAKQYRIGVIRRGNLHQYLLNNGFSEDQQLDTTAESITNYRKLFNDRVDFVGQSPTNLPYYLNQLGKSINEVEMVFKLYDQKSSCLAININTPADIINKIDKAFKEVTQADGLLP